MVCLTVIDSELVSSYEYGRIKVLSSAVKHIVLFCDFRIVREWQEVTVWKREMKKKALSFQVKSYTRQVNSVVYQYYTLKNNVMIHQAYTEQLVHCLI